MKKILRIFIILNLVLMLLPIQSVLAALPTDVVYEKYTVDSSWDRYSINNISAGFSAVDLFNVTAVINNDYASIGMQEMTVNANSVYLSYGSSSSAGLLNKNLVMRNPSARYYLELVRQYTYGNGALTTLTEHYSISAVNSGTRVATTAISTNNTQYCTITGGLSITAILKEETFTKSKGNLVQSNILSNNPNAYPLNGAHTDGYWYIRTATNVKGNLYETLIAPNGTYPDNNIKDGFFYVKTNKQIWHKYDTSPIQYVDESGKTVTQHVKGNNLVATVTGNPGEYPSNGLKDDAWYELVTNTSTNPSDPNYINKNYPKLNVATIRWNGSVNTSEENLVKTELDTKVKTTKTFSAANGFNTIGLRGTFEATQGKTMLMYSIDNSTPKVGFTNDSGIYPLDYEDILIPVDMVNEGTHTLKISAIDILGGRAEETLNFNIDKTAPTITIAPYTTTPTNKDVVVKATTNEGSLNATEHTFTKNGEFTFVATDLVGNTSKKTVKIINIDKVPPVLNSDLISTTISESSIKIDVNVAEENVKFKIDDIWQDSSTFIFNNLTPNSILIKEIEVKDELGNIAKETIKLYTLAVLEIKDIKTTTSDITMTVDLSKNENLPKTDYYLYKGEKEIKSIKNSTSSSIKFDGLAENTEYKLIYFVKNADDISVKKEVIIKTEKMEIIKPNEGQNNSGSTSSGSTSSGSSGSSSFGSDSASSSNSSSDLINSKDKSGNINTSKDTSLVHKLPEVTLLVGKEYDLNKLENLKDFKENFKVENGKIIPIKSGQLQSVNIVNIEGTTDPYIDTTKTWNKDKIEDLKEEGIFEYPTEKKFYPSDKVSFQDFIYYFNKQKLVEGEIIKRINDFSVLDETNIEKDINTPIRRDEAGLLISKMFKIEESNNTLEIKFDDLKTTEYQTELNSLIQKGILKGDDNGLLRPSDYLTRAELAELLDRIKNQK